MLMNSRDFWMFLYELALFAWIIKLIKNIRRLFSSLYGFSIKHALFSSFKKKKVIISL